MSDFSWFLPLFLIIFGVCFLFRLVSLTTPFVVMKGHRLPHRLLNALGLKRQENREDILIRIFLHPAVIVWVTMGLCFFIITLFAPAADSFHIISSYWQESGDGVSLSHRFLQLSDHLIVPALCGLGFLWVISLAHNKKTADQAALIFAVLTGFFLLCSFVMQGAQAASADTVFSMRGVRGGFWAATIPYVMGLSLWCTFAITIWGGFDRYRASFLSFSAILGAMAATDLGVIPSILSSFTFISGWLTLGFLIAPLFFEGRAVSAQYFKVRAKLRAA